MVLVFAASTALGQPAPPPDASGVPRQSRAEVERRLARRALENRAAMAHYEKNFAACASLSEEAGDAYQAACCHALNGNREAAFSQLAKAIDGKFRNLEHLDRDTDFDSIRDDPRWASERARLAAKVEAGDGVHPELQKIFNEDQGDRRAVATGQKMDWSQIAPRDKARRERVDAILAAGGAKFSADYHHAAMVFQHGETPAEIQRAHELALEAIRLDPDNDRARWLAAAAEDRKLMYEDKPQKWGTQFKVVDGKWVVWNVDPAITDTEREEWNVPTLAQARERAEQMNANLPKPQG